MHWIQKMWPSAAASLIAVTTVLLAVDDPQVNTLESRISVLEKPNGSKGMINPSARPQVKEGYNLFVTGELLYWAVYESGLSYGIENHNSNTLISQGEAKEVGHKYNFGGRLGIGYNMPHDQWDLCANWAFLENGDVKNSSAAPIGGAIFPIWNNHAITGDNIANMYVDHADAKWHTDINLINLELGREFFVSKWLTLRPFLGFAYAKLDQKLSVAYAGGLDLGPDNREHIHLRNDFWGFGPRLGLNTLFGMGHGFGFYGNGALSILNGHFNIRQQVRTFNRVLNTITDDLNLENKFSSGRATTELALGIRWDHTFENERYHLGLQCGWEQKIYFGQNRLWELLSTDVPAAHSVGNDELQIVGWTLAARFDF